MQEEKKKDMNAVSKEKETRMQKEKKKDINAVRKEKET